MNTDYWDLVGVLMPVLRGTPHWEDRHKVLWYVALCKLRGFAKTDDEKQNCARRFMAGKRKVSAPGTARRKRAEKELRAALANVPPELTAAIDAASQSDLAKQVIGGNAKAMNALVGSILKTHKVAAALVKQLLEAKLKEKSA